MQEVGVTAPALRLDGLTKRYGSNVAVNELTLEVQQGELYALLGPNGAGKTTTLRMVAGLLTPDAGDTFVLGRSVRDEPLAAKQRLAFLPDEPLLYGKLVAEGTLEELRAASGREGGTLESVFLRLVERQ